MDHCGVRMECLGWQGKKNGTRVLWCARCGAVATHLVKKGTVIRVDPIRLPANGGSK